MNPHDPCIHPGRARVRADAADQRGKAVQVNTTTALGACLGPFPLPATLGYYRQAVEAVQRKYARLGMTWAGTVYLWASAGRPQISLVTRFTVRSIRV